MPLKQPQHPGRVAIVSVGLLAAVSLAILFGTQTNTSPAGDSRPPAIQAITPQEGGQIRAQEKVGVNLRDDLSAVLLIDGNRIPEDQYTGAAELGIYEFQPGEGQEFREFEPGQHEMRVQFWPKELTEEEAIAEEKVSAYAWFFTVS